MLSRPRYGLPPPPVPRIQAPTARLSMSSAVMGAVIGVAAMLSPPRSATQQFAGRLGGDGVRQNDRQPDPGERIAVTLGKADAIEQDRRGAALFEVAADGNDRFGRLAVGAD